MKTTLLKTSILAITLLAGASAPAIAQSESPTPECPLGNPPGYGRNLTPEQWAEHRAAMQQTIATLRQKQADGSLTADEAAWLKNAEQRGGPRGPGMAGGRGPGKGPGAAPGNGRGQRHGLRDGTGPGHGPGAGPGNGNGRGQRRGLRDGTGPRAVDGTCPHVNAPGATDPQ